MNLYDLHEKLKFSYNSDEDCILEEFLIPSLCNSVRYRRLADYISRKTPEIRGFNRRGLFRMRQFYETYADNLKVSALLTQLTWTNHLLILSKSKSNEDV